MATSRPKHDPDAAASARSADGTTIGYQTRGRGPGLVVLHGAMESASDYTDLAEELSESFTVHVLDRRGRGASGPHGADHGLAVEVDDVRAVLRATGATLLFGVSSGGAIALQAALEVPELDRVAAYEPAISARGEQPAAEAAFVRRYEQALRRDDTATAIFELLKGMQVGPRWLRLLPRPVATALLRRLVAEERTSTADGPSFVDLVPSVRHDFRVSDEASADLRRLAGVSCPVLLIGGTKSPRYLDKAITELAEVLPDCRRVRLTGASHTAASNRDQGGEPERMAGELRAFFAAST